MNKKKKTFIGTQHHAKFIEQNNKIKIIIKRITKTTTCNN